MSDMLDKLTRAELLALARGRLACLPSARITTAIADARVAAARQRHSALQKDSRAAMAAWSSASQAEQDATVRALKEPMNARLWREADRKQEAERRARAAWQKAERSEDAAWRKLERLWAEQRAAWKALEGW